MSPEFPLTTLERLEDQCTQVVELRRNQRRNALISSLVVAIPGIVISGEIQRRVKGKALTPEIGRIYHAINGLLVFGGTRKLTSRVNAASSDELVTRRHVITQIWRQEPTLETHEILDKYGLRPPANFDQAHGAHEKILPRARRKITLVLLEGFQAALSVLIGKGF